jgi:hypothetical protein
VIVMSVVIVVTVVCCLFVCLGLLRANEARRARRQASSQRARLPPCHQNAVTEHKTKEYTIAAPVLRTGEAIRKMHSVFAFGANSLPRQT